MIMHNNNKVLCVPKNVLKNEICQFLKDICKFEVWSDKEKIDTNPTHQASNYTPHDQ